MKEKIALLDPLVHRLARRAAELDLNVSVVVKPVLCPMDERAIAFDSMMGSVLGSTAASTFSPSADGAEKELDLESRVKKLEARKCRCAPPLIKSSKP